MPSGPTTILFHQAYQIMEMVVVEEVQAEEVQVEVDHLIILLIRIQTRDGSHMIHPPGGLFWLT